MAINDLATNHPDWHMIYPVHLNNNVQKPVYDILGNANNVSLIGPQDYAPFVWLMNQSDLILTDSGGSSFAWQALLVMRDITERPEAVTADMAGK